jgi:hypothetical protein
MKIRNKNGRIHTAFSALDTLPGFWASATFLSLFGEQLTRWINTVQSFCGVKLHSHVIPANAGNGFAAQKRKRNRRHPHDAWLTDMRARFGPRKKPPDKRLR